MQKVESTCYDLINKCKLSNFNNINQKCVPVRDIRRRELSVYTQLYREDGINVCRGFINIRQQITFYISTNIYQTIYEGSCIKGMCLYSVVQTHGKEQYYCMIIFTLMCNKRFFLTLDLRFFNSSNNIAKSTPFYHQV